MIQAAGVVRRRTVVNGNFICAIRGPMLMITLGVLLAIDQMGTYELWPHLAGSADRVRSLFKLAERAGFETGMRRASVVAPLLLIAIGASVPGAECVSRICRCWTIWPSTGPSC